MTWNHRVVKKKYTSAEGGREYLHIHEVYYDENGKVYMATESGCDPTGEDISELLTDLSLMIRACALPILDYDEIPEEGAINLLNAQKIDVADR